MWILWERLSGDKEAFEAWLMRDCIFDGRRDGGIRSFEIVDAAVSQRAGWMIPDRRKFR